MWKKHPPNSLSAIGWSYRYRSPNYRGDKGLVRAYKNLKRAMGPYKALGRCSLEPLGSWVLRAPIIGGWGCGADQEIDFGFGCGCVASVRACEAVCGRVRGDGSPGARAKK